MKIPENMDSADLDAAGASDDDLRRSIRDWLDEQRDFDAAEFFEAYIDPAGPFRYCGSFDAWDGIKFYIENDPKFLAELLREWIKDGGY
jgi:hypothetical protein